MIKLKRLLATVVFCTLLLLPGATFSGAKILDDMRFINGEESIGKTQAQVLKELGEPANKGECHMSTPVDGESITLSGQGWAYRHQFNNGYSLLSICFVQGLSVAELRTDGTVGADRQQRVLTREIIDHRLMRNIIDGKPDRPAWVDPDGDKI